MYQKRYAFLESLKVLLSRPHNFGEDSQHGLLDVVEDGVLFAADND